MEEEAMEVLEKEVMVKVQQNQSRVVLRDDIKDNPPEHLKVFPIGMILHKSWKFHAILHLSFALKLSYGTTFPAVNKSSVRTAPSGAIDQVDFRYHALSMYSHKMAQMRTRCFMTKWDIKDGFWQLDCEEGEE